jgi:hypothetical protein
MDIGEITVDISMADSHTWIGRDGRAHVFMILGMDGLKARRIQSACLFAEEDLKAENSW